MNRRLVATPGDTEKGAFVDMPPVLPILLFPILLLFALHCWCARICVMRACVCAGNGRGRPCFTFQSPLFRHLFIACNAAIFLFTSLICALLAPPLSAVLTALIICNLFCDAWMILQKVFSSSFASLCPISHSVILLAHSWKWATLHCFFLQTLPACVCVRAQICFAS